MNNRQVVTQIGPGWWKGVSVIRIKLLPAELPQSVYENILARCRELQATAQLCAYSSEDSFQALTILLILRTQGGIADDVNRRLEQLGSMVQRVLQDANFEAEPAEISDRGDPMPAWLNPLDERDPGRIIGFYPAESTRGDYVPGSYGAGEARVDLTQLSNILASYPNSLMAVQWTPTWVFPAEQRVIETALKLREASERQRKPQPGTRTYATLRRMQSSGAVFIAMYAWGSANFLQDFSAQAKRFGLSTYPILDHPRIHAEHLLHADEYAVAAASHLGHDADLRNKLAPMLRRFTHLVPMDEAARVFRFPQRAQELRGVQINHTPAAGEPLPPAFSRKDGIYLGEHMDTKQPIYLNPSDLTRHGFFVGKTGSGKTVFALGLLHKLYTHKKRIPFLAIEPAKKEYRSLMEHIPDLRVYTPGRQDVAPMQLNLFLPPKGVRREQYQKSLHTIFSMAISMAHPLDIIFPQVIARVYARYGWRPNSTRDSEGVRVFGMHEFIREFQAFVQERYDSDPKTLNNLQNGGVMRLMALMNNPTFDTNNMIDVQELLEHPTVIELDALPDSQHKALVMGILLVHIMLVIQQRPESGSELRNLVLIDEAHLLLSSGGDSRENSPNPERGVVEMLQNMTLILRAYGTGLLFGDQSPAKLTNTIMDNVNLKLMFHLDSMYDRDALSRSAMLSPAMAESLVSMSSGRGYMFANGLHAPVHIAVPNAEAQLHLNKSLPDEQVRERMHVPIPAPFSQCAACKCCAGICDDAIRTEADFLSERLMDNKMVQSYLAQPTQTGLLAFMRKELPREVQKIMAEFHTVTDDEARMIDCTKAQFIRRLLISEECRLSEKELMREPEPDGEESNLRKGGLKLNRNREE